MPSKEKTAVLDVQYQPSVDVSVEQDWLTRLVVGNLSH